MTQDYVTRLQLQLRAAAEREARRGPVRRAARSRRVPAIAIAALALIAGVVVATGGWLRDSHSGPAGRPGLRVLEIKALAPQGGQLASGFGAVWFADPSGNVLRVDPGTGRVTDRIPAGQDIRTVTVGAGAVWALGPAGDVLQVDPAAGRVVARIRLGVPDLGQIMITRKTVWVLMGPELWRIDGARRRVGVFNGGPGPRSGASDGESLYVFRPDGILERRDARDGRRIALVRPALRGAIIAAAGGKVLLARDDGLVAIDPRDGRTLWQRQLRSARLNQVLIAGGSVWVQGTPIGSASDRLWRLDASAGRVLASLSLPEYGASGMAVVGDRVWIAAPNGRVQIVGR